MNHIPVMLDHVVDHLAPEAGSVILDGTFGGGGYSRRILQSADCTVLGVDQDPDAIARSEPLKAEFGDRFQLLPGRFGDLSD